MEVEVDYCSTAVLTVRVVRATRGAERDGARELRIGAARDVYARADRETKLHREERDATTDTRDENVMSRRDAGVHNRSPAYCARV